MTNIELLELIASKIDAVRDEVNDLTLKVVEDENYDLVFDNIVRMITDLEQVSSDARVLADEIDTIEIQCFVLSQFVLYIHINQKLKHMTVEKLIEKLSKFDPKMKVLGEFDSDGDEFMVKVDIKKVYKGDGFDDSDFDDVSPDEKFCIIQLKY